MLIGDVMRVTVDGDRCQGHTVCNMIEPRVFLLDDEDGHAYVADGHVGVEFEDAVRRAARNCPELAIVIEE